MPTFRLLLSFCLIAPLLFAGCERKRTNPISALTVESGAEIDSAQRQKEVFDRELENLDSLENTPCLPETPGAEKLIQAADRLNKWISDRKPDESWKPDELFVELEAEMKKTAGTASELVRLLHLLQDKEVLDEQGIPVKASESLEEERKKIGETLSRFGDELKELAIRTGISNISASLEQVVQLRKKFDGLATIKNLGARDIRAFAKQLEPETKLFSDIADIVKKLASEFQIEGLFIHSADVEHLKQGIWFRDLSDWARGEKQDSLERARNLFDWTVCNIDLRDRVIPFGQESQIELPQQYPWQTILLGNGTVWDRIWVFVELLRQQRIDACLLSVPHPEQPELPLVWAVGVLLDGEIYLFLPLHGMPLPGPKGPQLAEDGSLTCEIATFSQVLKDDALLRKLDLSDEAKFPVTAESLKQTTFLLLATPETASMRMKVLEAELSGEQNMILSTDLREQRRRFGEIADGKAVDVWKYPFRTKFEQHLMVRLTNQLMMTFLQPNPKRMNYPLWTGRILYFKGKINGQESAMTYYQEARIPDREIMEYRNHAEFRNDPSRAQLLRIVSANASFWLGQASFEVDSLPASKDFFTELQSNPYHNWRGAVQFMLGRLAERNKDYDEAIRRFDRAIDGPSALGNRLRAKWLREIPR